MSVKSNLGSLLTNRSSTSYAIHTALDKLKDKDISPEEALAIFKDTTARTDKLLDGVTADEAAGIAEYVLSQPSLMKKGISIVSLLVALTTGYMSNSNVTGPIGIVSSYSGNNIPVTLKVEVAKWVNKNHCSDTLCVITSIVPAGKGYNVAYQSNDIELKFNYVRPLTPIQDAIPFSHVPSITGTNLRR